VIHNFWAAVEMLKEVHVPLNVTKFILTSWKTQIIKMNAF
jgi:hypothetical protein